MAHDYWLEPEAFMMPAGSSVIVRMYLGDDFKIEEERPFQKNQTPRFQMFSAQETQNLLPSGQDGKSPVAQVTPRVAGNYLIAMERNAQNIKLDAEKFRQYLAEEGLNQIIALRQQSGEDKTEGRERYSRYLKSLLKVGDRNTDVYNRIVGHRLELVPQANPYELKVGDPLKVRVYFDGKPLSGAKIFAYSREAGQVFTQSATTSGDGSMSFTLDRPGQWLIRLVHMRRCAA
ncbi:MAG: DUF4198 domain-containing protein, partial [Pyrinomonadaceae bacterium]|nr:DUF4198 domain-containing protein [Pyrinomonadaceae bacterium]